MSQCNKILTAFCNYSLLLAKALYFKTNISSIKFLINTHCFISYYKIVLYYVLRIPLCPTCLCALHTYVLYVLTCLRVFVLLPLMSLPSFMPSFVYMPYVASLFYVTSFFTCLASPPLLTCLTCLHFFTYLQFLTCLSCFHCFL